MVFMEEKVMSKVIRISGSTESVIKFFKDYCKKLYPDMVSFIDDTSDDDLIRHIIQDYIELKYGVDIEDQTKSY